AAKLGHSAVPEDIEESESGVEQRRRVAGRELAAGAERARVTRSCRTGADRQSEGVGGVVERTVTGRARDVPVATQLLVEEERSTQVHQSRTGWRELADGDHAPPRELSTKLRVERRGRRDAAAVPRRVLARDSQKQCGT